MVAIDLPFPRCSIILVTEACRATMAYLVYKVWLRPILFRISKCDQILILLAIETGSRVGGNRLLLSSMKIEPTQVSLCLIH